MKIVYLGLGSNLGDRESLIRSALDRLDSPGLRLTRVSSLYESEPIGLREQPWFLNCVAEFETELFPLQLLQRIHRIERELGRRRTVLNGPRTIDIDILFYGASRIEARGLTVPHPRYCERRFVLAPLAELAPALRDPVTGQSAATLLAAVRGQSIRRVAFDHPKAARSTQ